MTNAPLPLAPQGLLCDLLAYPERAEIATRQPTFGWEVNGGQPGPDQRAYQVLVASNEEALRSDHGDLWDTGRVNSSQSLHILYGGMALQWGQSGFWKVRTWTDAVTPSPWSQWQRFTIAAAPLGEATSVYRPETVRLSPVKTTLLTPSTCLADFGRHAFGWLEIEAVVPSPVPVTVRLGERLREGRIDRTPEGTIRYAESTLILQPGQKVYRVELQPDQRNTQEPMAISLPKELGVVLPFRYAEIDGTGDGVALKMVRVQYPFNENAASFHSSDPRLNAVWELCHYTMLATSFTGYYVDVDRERIPYEADAYINQLSHYAVDREFSMARRTHEYLLQHPTWPTEWKQHSILLAWADYEATGDPRSLQRSYEILKQEKLLLSHARPDGLLDTRNLRDIVDWPMGERDGYDFQPVNTVVNAFYFQTLQAMERIASVLGRKEDVIDFKRRSEAVAKQINAVLLDPERGIYRDGEGSEHASLHANLFPLAFGLVPLENRATVVEFIKSRGMACSVYPAQFLLEGLFANHEADYAIQLMTDGGLRSWHNMISKGATITWEAWDQTLKPNQDWNHAWGSAPANIISRYVLGVRPLEPGYGKILVQPQLGPLSQVEGVVPTIRGPIHVRAWRDSRTGGEICCKVQAPANVQVVT